MTQEEKARAYDKALSVALETYQTQPMYRDWLEEMFPELKESEDERIREWLICYFKEVCDNVSEKEKKGVIAWLEKQGEHSPVVIIPKFRVDDNIKTTNEEPLTITKIDDKGYWSEDLFICGFDDAAKWELVEQKPAWSEEDKKFINEIEESLLAYKIIVMDNDRELANYIEKEINWLKSLKGRVQPKPKQEWSEEDEKHIMAIDLAENRCGGKWHCCGEKCPLSEHTPWLKSLKPQNHWKPSDEQMNNK